MFGLLAIIAVAANTGLNIEFNSMLNLGQKQRKEYQAKMFLIFTVASIIIKSDYK